MTTPDTAPAVYVSGLLKSFRGAGGRHQDVLRGVDFSAQRGAVTTLLGTNGAGKSTSLACAQGLLQPDGGTVRLLDQEPWRAPAQLRARVGVMLQDGGLPPSQKPLAYLRHVAGLYAQPRPVNELAERLGLNEFAGTSIRRLSGGQKQRVALAVALVGNPEVLFLDEPSAGLDPQSRQVVFELITELRADGRAIVLTTHLLEDAERLSDTIFVIDRGRTVAHGTVEELIGADGPGDLTVAFADGVVPTWPSGINALPLAAGRWQVPALDSPATLARITAEWAAAGILPRELRLERRSLEDAFLTLAAEAEQTPSGTETGTEQTPPAPQGPRARLARVAGRRQR
ncbi:ABC transporter ATP-binding protein [Galactobacter caseinivorans]|uniref:ABC transporter ATP-binding protein n=1 Tax=Galactobacter caseinivorans TaxID=2676123 RepID=A0A496PL62_9MICC|nr:ABC transporter ATP-binding protein [Galactobacter caseinivorans]